jgi:hypothetical protein
MIRLIAAIALLGCAVAQPERASALYRQNGVQYVGICYWLQGDDGSRVAESQAKPDRRYSLHIRNNVAGFLSVWSTADGTQLTPMPTPWVGLEMAPPGEFVPSGVFRIAPENSPQGLFVLFARSQTEQVTTVAEGLAKLERLKHSQVAETVTEGVNVGTYVVNLFGNQPATTIRLMR